jgi:Uroporphyrinogen decarboxylase (URO-D)
MQEKPFDNLIADSQGTAVKPVSPRQFDFERYADYEASLLERNRAFWQAPSGMAVYQRFRVPQVYTFGCQDMESSLTLQLGALQESMKYEMDIPNFLEPWYGIGTMAGAFGADYEWRAGQAPAIKAPFRSVEEALKREIRPVEETSIGRRTLQMIEYFLDQTQGRLPISLTDTQSPMNTASFLVETSSFYMSFYDNPDGLKQLLGLIAEQLVRFTLKQVELIGDALVYPGHGFASSRAFSALGMSDDVMITLSPQQYCEFEIPAIETAAKPFAGAAFHSCGNWSGRTEAVKKIANLLMVDGAFSAQTDPDCNPITPFTESFANTGVVVNARIVGDAEVVLDKARRLWTPNMKLIVVTYSKTPQEQAHTYSKLRSVTGNW